MVACVVLIAVWIVIQVVSATPLGSQQRNELEFWRSQQRRRALLGRQETGTRCTSADPAQGLAERLNDEIAKGGENYILSLCPNTTYPITAPLKFTSKGQEVSTAGYPIDDSRAKLLVSGSTAGDGTGHSIAIQGGCQTCGGVKIRNIQIDGNRQGAPPISGGGNIEMGGPGGEQLIEYVKSSNPRSWSCLHIAEGNLDCSGTTIRYNDIGPCGSDTFGQWADGISLSCKNSQVYDNWIVDPTDGGIVIFQSPGSLIQNNTVWIENSTCLGGINLVDYDPFAGNYTGVKVVNNTVVGGYANTDSSNGPQFANNTKNAIIKMGIATGLKPWFGDKWGNSSAFGASVTNNRLSGAFGFGIPVAGVKDFVVANNTLFGNTSFVGYRGPNCTDKDVLPPPSAFVADPDSIQSSVVSGFALHKITALLCLTPRNSGSA